MGTLGTFSVEELARDAGASAAAAAAAMVTRTDTVEMLDAMQSVCLLFDSFETTIAHLID